MRVECFVPFHVYTKRVKALERIIHNINYERVRLLRFWIILILIIALIRDQVRIDPKNRPVSPTSFTQKQRFLSIELCWL